jgi:hypothetical protein
MQRTEDGFEKGAVLVRRDQRLGQFSEKFLEESRDGVRVRAAERSEVVCSA